MNKNLLKLFAVALAVLPMKAETFVIDETTYQADVLINKEIGPGVLYQRYRLPEYPLNVNVLKVDLNNKYNRVETTQASDRLGSTEGLVSQAARQTTSGHIALAGANANFWCTTEKPWSDYMRGTPFGANVRNGKIITNTNEFTDLWQGTGSRTGVVSIDTNKRLWIESMDWKGTVSSSRWTSPADIAQVNMIARENQISMFNSFYGTSRTLNSVETNTQVYCVLAEGAQWAANKDMTVEVKAVTKDAAANSGTLGDYDLCLVGCGSGKALLDQLAVGDKIVINHYWYTCANGDKPNIEQAVAGNAMVLVNGELTVRNENEAYNSKTYSRTGYGMSKDGKTLFVIVIDMSTDPVYGISKGCNTATMAQIVKQLGGWNLCTMDAGGSAQMFVKDKIVNKTTEGTPRAVANGWMIYSIAEPEQTVSRIEFLDYNLEVPIYASYTPTILAYDKYGNLINEDLQGVTLSCDANVGTCNGSTFTASATSAKGKITATYNGISVTKDVEVKLSDVSIRIKNLLIDNVRQYPIEVVSVNGLKTYYCNPANLTWTVADPKIVSIDENGVLRGLAEGTTTITGVMGEFKDEAQVTVEIAPSSRMNISNADWKFTSSLANNFAWNGDMITFNYKGGRVNSMEMSKDIVFYSIPSSIVFDIESTLPFTSFVVDLRSKDITTYNKVEINQPVPANTRTAIKIPIEALGDPNDLALYPISLHKVVYYVDKTNAVIGNNSIKVNAFYAEYPEKGAVETVAGDESVIRFYPNPVADGVLNIFSSKEGICNVSIVNLQGAVVKQTVIDLRQGATSVDVADLQSGIYLMSLSVGDICVTDKLLIK